MKNDKCFVYILKCADDTLYTGWTNDLQKRVLGHNSGKASKYTRSRLPVKLVYKQECFSKRLAMQRECAIKKLSRTKKLELIAKQKSVD